MIDDGDTGIRRRVHTSDTETREVRVCSLRAKLRSGGNSVLECRSLTIGFSMKQERRWLKWRGKGGRSLPFRGVQMSGKSLKAALPSRKS